MIRNAMDLDDYEDQGSMDAYVQWCIGFRDAQRSLWESECALIEQSIL